MHETRPSHTAEMVAMRRAAHQVFDGEPKVINDPFAVRIIGTEAEARMRAMRQQSAFAKVGRAFMGARRRGSEEAGTRAVEQVVTQYVILGAGLVTCAYRAEVAARLRTFEVDLSLTQ